MTTEAKARDNTEEEALMAIESEERRRERARLLDEAIAVGALPRRDEMERYTFGNANPLHRDYDVAEQAREWTPGTGLCVYIWGPAYATVKLGCAYATVKLGCALLNNALDKLYSVASCDMRAIINMHAGHARREYRTAAVLLARNIDAPLWGCPGALEPVIDLLSTRRDAGRVTIATAQVSPERFVDAEAAPEVQTAQAAVLDCLNTAAGGPLVLHLQG